MGKRNTILFFGIFAIIILVLAQVIIYNGVWKQKDEMLSLRYRLLSQEAVATLRGERSVDVYDTVRFILDKYSEEASAELQEIKDIQKLDEKKKEIFDFFSGVLNQEQDLSSYLSSYFEKMGFEKDFNHRIEIINLEIIGKDTFSIYQSNYLTESRSLKNPVTRKSKSSILVYRPRLEDNFYTLFFEYYIDFSDKQRMILKETGASLTMSIFSILVVLVIYLITYRNLLEEKRLSDLKTDFINNMTHELKTPLATITVAGKTLETEKILKDESKIIETARLIGKQSLNLNLLINLILEISMWERAQFELDRKKIDIEEIMNEIVLSFIKGSGEDVALNQKYDLKGIKPDIDLIYFTTMINNLLSNALKYSDKDPVINVEGFVENKHICITVADNGIGISRNDQKHVFDKFYRASSGNIHEYKGLGLGLYYVKKIALAHGGDVTLSSKPGKGTVFKVMIPY